MWTYVSEVKWEGARNGVLGTNGKPDIAATAPPEFGGSADRWTPEHLVAAALGSCLMMAALYFVERMKVGLKGYESRVTETVGKTPAGLAITGMKVEVAAVVASEEDRGKMAKVIEMAEKNCPVSGVMKCPIEVVLDCSVGER